MKTLSLGTKLQVQDEYDTYIDVGNLTSIGVPGPTKGEIEVTDFDSVAKEFLGTLPDNGELPFSGFLNEENAGQDLLYLDANDPDAGERNFRVIFTRQATQYDFAGFVKSFLAQAPGAEQAYTFTGSIRVSGAVTKGAIAP